MGRYTINRTPQKLPVPDAIRTHPGLVVKHYHQRMALFYITIKIKGATNNGTHSISTKRPWQQHCQRNSTVLYAAANIGPQI